MGIPRFVPLRYRFIVTTAGMLVFILGALALVLGYQQSRTIKQQLEKRGLAIAQSLAAVSIADLMTYNYISLERSANQAAKHPDIIYVIFHDKEGRVAGFSGRSDLQGKFLDDKVTRSALAAKTPLIQDVKLARRQIPALDIAVPILLPKTQEQWGTVRVSLSLALMYQQLRQTRWTILTVGLVALACGTLVSVWAAGRITRPLNRLVRGTREAARGNLSQDIRVNTGDEVEALAANFDVMIHEIIAHREQLEKQLLEIKRLQRYTEQLLTAMSDGLLTVDMAGRISVINPAAAILLGMTDGETMNRCHISECLMPFPALERYVGELVANPGDRQPQEIQLPGENETRSLLVSCSLLKNRKKSAPGDYSELARYYHAEKNGSVHAADRTLSGPGDTGRRNGPRNQESVVFH